MKKKTFSWKWEKAVSDNDDQGYDEANTNDGDFRLPIVVMEQDDDEEEAPAIHWLNSLSLLTVWKIKFFYKKYTEIS